MKEKIDEIFYDLKNEVITEKQAHQKVLDLLQEPKLVKCDNCENMVEMTVIKEMCPICYC